MIPSKPVTPEQVERAIEILENELPNAKSERHREGLEGAIETLREYQSKNLNQNPISKT